MANAVLDRLTFEQPRTAEYISATELTAMTGQPSDNFASVVLKELVDNALDAAEEAGRAPEVDIQADYTDGIITLTICDNGPGIPPETVERIVNFETRTSSKSFYLSPTRGLQGNAFKTVIGIPYALGVRDPVTVEAGGKRHSIEVRVTPAGAVRVFPVVDSSARTDGTAVTVRIPTEDQSFDPFQWANAYAVFNPHASVKIGISGEDIKHANTDDQENSTFYRTVNFPDGWKRFLPSNPTYPHWYTPEAFKRLAYGYMEEADPTLREFIRTFAGLSATATAKAIAGKFPGVERLRDLDGRDDQLEKLLLEMKKQAREINPPALGMIGKEHFETRFKEWYGIGRPWYQKAYQTIDGLPVGIEVFVAETEDQGDLFTGINFAPTFDDPFSRTSLITPEFQTTGLRSFLHRCYAMPGAESRFNVAVAVHLTCPSLQFLDRGKTSLVLPKAVERLLAKTLWGTLKTLYKAGKRAERDARREQNRRVEIWRRLSDDVTFKEAVFDHLPKAIDRVSGGYVFYARQLFYDIRDPVKNETGKELEYNYFSQRLLPEYQRIKESIPLLRYDPRGILHEPHTGISIPVGTGEIEAYKIPKWRYNKVLYIEKKGFWPILEAAKIAERFDCAVMLGEGYATEASRVFFERAQRDWDFQLFVLHDADPAGYNIARTLAEETERMPGYSVKVIDIGLHVEEGLALGLSTETFTRKKELPSILRDRLTDVERQYFEGVEVGKNQWKCQRIELNAFTSPGLIKFIEDKLTEHGSGKVIPPQDYLENDAEAKFRDQVKMRFDRAILEIVDSDSLAKKFADELRESIKFDQAPAWVDRGLRADQAQSWDAALLKAISEKLSAEDARIVKMARGWLQEKSRA